MVPVISRTTTIGEYGTYSRPNTHELFLNLKVASGNGRDYKLRGDNE